MGIWSHHPEAKSIDLTAPWEEGGLNKYVNQPALVVGGSSSVGQFGKRPQPGHYACL